MIKLPDMAKSESESNNAMLIELTRKVNQILVDDIELRREVAEKQNRFNPWIVLLGTLTIVGGFASIFLQNNNAQLTTALKLETLTLAVSTAGDDRWKKADAAIYHESQNSVNMQIHEGLSEQIVLVNQTTERMRTKVQSLEEKYNIINLKVLRNTIALEQIKMHHNTEHLPDEQAKVKERTNYSPATSNP